MDVAARAGRPHPGSSRRAGRPARGSSAVREPHGLPGVGCPCTAGRGQRPDEQRLPVRTEGRLVRSPPHLTTGAAAGHLRARPRHVGRRPGRPHRGRGALRDVGALCHDPWGRCPDRGKDRAGHLAGGARGVGGVRPIRTDGRGPDRRGHHHGRHRGRTPDQLGAVVRALAGRHPGSERRHPAGPGRTTTVSQHLPPAGHRRSHAVGPPAWHGARAEDGAGLLGRERVGQHARRPDRRRRRPPGGGRERCFRRPFPRRGAGSPRPDSTGASGSAAPAGAVLRRDRCGKQHLRRDRSEPGGGYAVASPRRAGTVGLASGQVPLHRGERVAGNHLGPARRGPEVVPRGRRGRPGRRRPDP